MTCGGAQQGHRALRGLGLKSDLMAMTSTGRRTFKWMCMREVESAARWAPLLTWNPATGGGGHTGGSVVSRSAQV